MVRTPTVSSPVLLTGLLIGALLASGLAIIDANAAADASTAAGVSATGADPLQPTPFISSAGEVKTNSASTVSGQAGTFTARGLTVKAGAGLAEASVESVTIGGKSIGPVAAKCVDGVTTYSGHGPEAPAANLRVKYRSGAGATITVIDGHGKAVQTITVAVATCSKGPQPTTPPTSVPTSPPSSTRPPATQPPTGTAPPKDRLVRPAPKPTPVPGHHAVTG